MVARHARRRRQSPQHARGKEPQSDRSSTSGRFIVIVTILAVAATIVAYSPALTAPFQFDDIGSITTNRSIERLWPPSVPLNPPRGVAVSGRPVVNYSLAVDYGINRALGVDQGQDPGGARKTVSYRVTNIALHLACGLILLGVLRRSFRSPVLPDEWTTSADMLAALVTAFWLIHPIQSEVVDYVIQRTESIASLCYLATLYASIRAWDAAKRHATIAWCVAAAIACAVGTASKEMMITAPLTVLLYDRAFRARSWRELAERRGGRPWLYPVLCATSLLTFAFVARGARADTVGFRLGVAWYEYLYSQAWAILHYLQLVLWPDPLTFDYGRNPISGLRGVPGTIVLTAALVAAIAAWRRAPWLGFFGIWFFVLLGPSSSVVPIRTEIAAERRMYLALVPVLALIAVAAEWTRRRVASMNAAQRKQWMLRVGLGVGLIVVVVSGNTAARAASLMTSEDGSLAHFAVWTIRLVIAVAGAIVAWRLIACGRRALLIVVACLLVACTYARSRTYGDPEALWRGATTSVPTNARAFDNLAAAILRKSPSRAPEAESLLRTATSLDSTYLPAWRNLATVVAEQGRFDEARLLLERLLAIDSTYVDAHERLGSVLVAMGRPDRALPYLERAATHAPNAENLVALGGAYGALGRLDEAASAFQRALQQDASRIDAMVFLGNVLTEQGRAGDALPYLQEAVRRQPEVGYGFAVLSLALARLGRAAEANDAARTASQRSGNDPAVLLLSGRAMLLTGRVADAEQYFAEAVRLEPADPEALTRYGHVETQLGKRTEAAQLFTRALQLRPDYVPAQRGMGALRVPAKR
jgi:tetratricopeptide (TPR) repeat protein